MTNWDQKYLEDISEHLKDIAHSLQIISGRTKVTEVNKKETYADRYFAPSYPKPNPDGMHLNNDK